MSGSPLDAQGKLRLCGTALLAGSQLCTECTMQLLSLSLSPFLLVLQAGGRMNGVTLAWSYPVWAEFQLSRDRWLKADGLGCLIERVKAESWVLTCYTYRL